MKYAICFLALFMATRSLCAQTDVELWYPTTSTDATVYKVRLNAFAGLKSPVEEGVEVYWTCTNHDVPFAPLQVILDNKPYWSFLIWTGNTPGRDIHVERATSRSGRRDFYILRVEGEPGPVPPPDPDVDPDLTGFAKVVYDLGKEVPKPRRASESMLLGKIYADTASAIAAGAVKSKAQAFQLVQKGINDLEPGLPPNKGWAPTWENCHERIKSQLAACGDDIGKIRAVMEQVALGMRSLSVS